MIKEQEKQMNITNLFTDEFDESKRKWEEEICLEPDRSISGGLAFRLCGNKTRGVFVQYVNQKSEQSEILHKGDRILKVNGIDVRRLTCDQTAKILRLAVYNNGYALLQISRKKRCEEDKLSDVSKDENGNFHYCYPINDDLITNNNTSLSVSLSDMTESSEPVVYAQAVTSFHYCDNLTRTKCAQLVCFSQNNKQQFSSACEQQRKFSIFGYVKQLGDDENDFEYDEKCAERPKCFMKLRWHVVKHRWATNAMKFLPKSASDFFGSRIYQKAYYNLI
ncbi:unnamed protein product [Onchocerca ochengi]|uniref:PDZ domain-containing protein n=1 Tax=Onchocerca ochengi TaxID=42157 RepID=A0A182ED10_ONCOC|nr:unnamed protein product [Onchocerca ochengi]